MNNQGLSTTKTLGSEAFKTIEIPALPNKTYVLYDYRHTDGELFSTVAKSLEMCRRHRDAWLEEKEAKKRNGRSNKKLRHILLQHYF